MTKDEALKMAIDDLELCNGAQTVEEIIIYTHDAIQACKEALEQPTLTYEDGFAHGYEAHRAEQALEQPAQEPVGYVTNSGLSAVFNLGVNLDDDTPLYTHPAPVWQGLSDDEIAKVFDDIGVSTTNRKIYRAIEQTLKDKNT